LGEFYKYVAPPALPSLGKLILSKIQRTRVKVDAGFWCRKHHLPDMRMFLPALVSSALLFGSLLAAPPEEATPKAPDAKAGTRLKFQAYDGDEKEQAKMTFQINTLDIRQPSEFLNIGDTIRNTTFKLIKFSHKDFKNSTTGENNDVSELTIVNTKTKENFVLVLNNVVLVR
jgi:hypothetical protein